MNISLKRKNSSALKEQELENEQKNTNKKKYEYF